MKRSTQKGFTRISFRAAAGCGALLLCAALATPAYAQGTAAAKPEEAKKEPQFSASAILIERADKPVADVAIPDDFRVATYEYVVNRVTKTGRFKQVFRAGDSRAKDVADLVTLRTVAIEFEKGSEKKRDVTTFKGWTDMKMHVAIEDRDGKVLVDQDITGKGHFTLLPSSGSTNLDATKDFANKVAKMVNENFKAPTPAPKP